MRVHVMYGKIIIQWGFCGMLYESLHMQAYDLSKDHKPDLEVEKERILKAGGFIQFGRVNGSLNLARAIGTQNFFQLDLNSKEEN